MIGIDALKCGRSGSTAVADMSLDGPWKQVGDVTRLDSRSSSLSKSFSAVC